jgi:hypothetical protein
MGVRHGILDIITVMQINCLRQTEAVPLMAVGGNGAA